MVIRWQQQHGASGTSSQTGMCRGVFSVPARMAFGLWDAIECSGHHGREHARHNEREEDRNSVQPNRTKNLPTMPSPERAVGRNTATSEKGGSRSPPDQFHRPLHRCPIGDRPFASGQNDVLDSTIASSTRCRITASESDSSVTPLIEKPNSDITPKAGIIDSGSARWPKQTLPASHAGNHTTSTASKAPSYISIIELP